MNLKAIETEYKGYKFRSRTEARWAVFFDTLGWEYEYELEGFQLDNKLRYLPDFYVQIPSDEGFKGWYAEVKPRNVKLSEYDTRKIETFSKSENLLLLEGPPDINAVYKYVSNYEGEIHYGDVTFDDIKFGVYYGDSTDLGSELMVSAFKNAKQARFEFDGNEEILSKAIKDREEHANASWRKYIIRKSLSRSSLTMEDLRKGNTFALFDASSNKFIALSSKNKDDTSYEYTDNLEIFYTEEEVNHVAGKINKEVYCDLSGRYLFDREIAIIRVDILKMKFLFDSRRVFSDIEYVEMYKKHN